MTPEPTAIDTFLAAIAEDAFHDCNCACVDCEFRNLLKAVGVANERPIYVGLNVGAETLTN